MEFHNIVIASFIIIIAYMYVENKYNDVGYEVATFDNRRYLVRNLDDRQEAANLLAKIRKNLEDLCDDLKKVYPKNDAVNRLIIKFNPESISETAKNSKYTSYSVNKGEKIVLCLRARDDTEKLIDENTLMFVSIHEIAHIMTKSVGHKQEFWDNFKFVLKEAQDNGYYKCIDFSSRPQKYCGIEVTSSPQRC